MDISAGYVLLSPWQRWSKICLTQTHLTSHGLWLISPSIPCSICAPPPPPPPTPQTGNKDILFYQQVFLLIASPNPVEQIKKFARIFCLLAFHFVSQQQQRQQQKQHILQFAVFTLSSLLWIEKCNSQRKCVPTAPLDSLCTCSHKSLCDEIRETVTFVQQWNNCNLR